MAAVVRYAAGRGPGRRFPARRATNRGSCRATSDNARDNRAILPLIANASTTTARTESTYTPSTAPHGGTSRDGAFTTTRKISTPRSSLQTVTLGRYLVSPIRLQFACGGDSIAGRPPLFSHALVTPDRVFISVHKADVDFFSVFHLLPARSRASTLPKSERLQQ